MKKPRKRYASAAEIEREIDKANSNAKALEDSAASTETYA